MIGMFKINEDLSIYLTRGDVACFYVGLEMDGKDYTFRQGEVIRLNVFEKKSCDCVVLQKDFYAEEEKKRVEVLLSKKDTTIGDHISKPKDYWYEVILNPGEYEETVIGYDEDGAKVLRLFPEGKDKGVEE